MWIDNSTDFKEFYVTYYILHMHLMHTRRVRSWLNFSMIYYMLDCYRLLNLEVCVCMCACYICTYVHDAGTHTHTHISI